MVRFFRVGGLFLLIALLALSLGTAACGGLGDDGDEKPTIVFSDSELD